MPPGTGDVQLTIAQQVPLSGAVIVSTPQDLALIDARKGLAMFRKVNMPVLGIVENMSTFICPKCGERSDIFGHGGAKAEAEKLDVPFLGEVPLHMDVRATSDSGKPDHGHGAGQPAGADLPRPRSRGLGRARGGPGQGHEAAGARGRPWRRSAARHVRDPGRARASGRAAARHEPVGRGAGALEGAAGDGRAASATSRSASYGRVGNYAVRVVFDDGHDTGLFMWSYLHMLGLQKDKRWAEYLAELKEKGLSRD